MNMEDNDSYSNMVNSLMIIIYYYVEATRHLKFAAIEKVG